MAFNRSMSDQELYRKVLIGFSLLQPVLSGILYALTTTNAFILVLLLLIGGVELMMAHYGWEHKAARGTARVLWILLPAGFLAAALMAYAGSGADMGQAGQMLVNIPLSLHNMVVVFMPSMVLAALSARAMDANLLRVMSVISVLTAGSLYLIPALTERVSWGVDNLYFRLFCLACEIAVAITAFLIPPTVSFAKRWERNPKNLPEKEETSEE